MNTADNLLEALSLIRREIRELEHQENYVKERIYFLMDQNRTNHLHTQNFDATRTFKTREILRRTDVPDNIWEAYATQTTFPQLSIRPL